MTIDMIATRATKKIAKLALPLVGRVAGLTTPKRGQPVFVVGTGRCGTDLLLKILNSHPRIVQFPGEANDLWHPKLFPVNTARIDTAPIEIDPRAYAELSMAHWPSHHSERIQQVFRGFHLIAGRRRTLVVKSAMISFMIPKILDLFPNARFIHLYRYGPSVVESYFKKNFGKYSHFRCTEAEYYRFCARYWNSCILEIERCRTTLSLDKRGIYFELSYEDLCGDSERALNRIADYIGVDLGAFAFDLSALRNTNYKVADKDARWRMLVQDEMYPAMRLKGYLP